MTFIFSCLLAFQSLFMPFNEGKGNTTACNGEMLTVQPSCDWVDGVKGKALLLNGFTSRIIVPHAQLTEECKDFTIDLWICPISFPKSPCPVVCRENAPARQGFSLYLDARGRVSFRISNGADSIGCQATQPLALRQWSRLTCSYQNGKAIRLAINAQETASKACQLNGQPSIDTIDLWIGRTPIKTPSEYENKNIPTFNTLDAALDEFSLQTGATLYDKVLAGGFSQPTAPTLEPRILPSGPKEAMTFGSWYIPLKYYKQWDEQWRGETPDVVTAFGAEVPYRVVFWRGISYAPCFVTEQGNWMSNEFVERLKVTKWGCCESMSDKHADFSSVRILENTPARTVVLWRNAPVGVNQKFPYYNDETMWGDWSEETYTFYPDGVGVRKMDVWSSQLDEWYEWSQSLQVLHPHQRPEDVLDGNKIMSVAAMDGRNQTYGWTWDCEATQHGPTLPGANIQVTYLKSRWNPFLILDDRDGKNEKGENGPAITRYVGKWSEYSPFPWRNHWPVVQDYVIGRYATTPDGPAHTYTATQYNAPYEKGNGKMTKLMLCGCTDRDAADLVPLAKSWLRAPEMTCAKGGKVTYDVTQRAYLPTPQQCQGALTLRASEQQPIEGICLVVKGWKQTVPSSIRVDGKTLTDNQWRCGLHNTYAGQDLIVWLNIRSQTTTQIKLK